jgi:DNA-binding CsgD family transcriptional regulator
VNGAPNAVEISAAALEAGRAYGDPWIVLALLTVAGLASLADELSDGEAQLHEALAEAHRLQLPVREADALEALAAAASIRQQDEQAARLAGAADAIRVRVDAGPTLWTAAIEPHLAASSARLGPERYDEAWQDGAASTTDEAVAYAQRMRGSRARPPSGWAALTPTEARVVDLAVTGLTNREVAERLFVSAGTVKTHLAHIYAKLQVSSRVELAAMANARVTAGQARRQDDGEAEPLGPQHPGRSR